MRRSSRLGGMTKVLSADLLTPSGGLQGLLIINSSRLSPKVSEIMEVLKDNQGPPDYRGQMESFGLVKAGISKSRPLGPRMALQEQLLPKFEKSQNGAARLYLVIWKTTKVLQSINNNKRCLVVKIQEVPRFPGLDQKWLTCQIRFSRGHSGSSRFNKVGKGLYWCSG